jgi:hypothetical protein
MSVVSMSDGLAFPGQSLRVGDDRRELIAALQVRLEALGCGPVTPDGVFGSRTRVAVQTFQLRRGIVADGVVGPATWHELFPEVTPPVSRAPAPLAAEVLKTASAEVGVRESGGPNRGPRVDEYIRNVGLDPTRGAYSWCAAFVYFCFTRASASLGVHNPCAKTAGVLAHWHKAPAWAKIDASIARDDPRVIRPGVIFIADHGGGKGHTGLVERAEHGSVHTIEGNTNAGGSREGDGVYRRIRPLSQISAGFIDYGLPKPS